MLRLLLSGVVVLSQLCPASAAYLVDFGSGDRMAVDAYREDGDWVHLRRNGEDLSVPRARVRALLDESGTRHVAPREAPRATRPALR